MRGSTSSAVASLIASLGTLASRLLALAVLECRQAGIGLAWMLGLAVGAAVFVLTGWIALLAAILILLVQSGSVGWGSALAAAALLSFSAAGGLAWLVLRRSRALLLPATQRQMRLMLGTPDREDP